MRIVFMGTPEIAETCLIEILRNSLEVVGVFTREDKPVGRKQTITSPPVKVRAEENGIPVFQPKTMRDPEAQEALRELEPDLVVVVAYGRILPPEVLEIPTYGCINLHVSLLPKYRGAAPIQWAVINGEKETGVTIMQLDEGLDTGDILAQKPLSIGPDATAGEVFGQVGSAGARLLVETVERIRLGEIEPQPQGEGATQAPPLTKDMVQIDFTKPAAEVHNLVRGANPKPLAWFLHEGKRIKVVQTKPNAAKGQPGAVVAPSPLIVGCGDASLELLRVVPEGAKAMTGEAWAAGRRFKPGDKLV